ncbi:MAG: alcohol dehydrogenase catalytic domain-containing protein, partial [Hyphomicrobiaceae bacterium]
MAIQSRFLFKERAESGALGLRSVALGDPEDDQVLVKIHSASICGTDLHIFKWNDWAARTYRPPIRLGHEFGGTVTAVGPDVKAIKLGEHVTAETHIACGHCHQCRLNRRHTCENLQLFSRIGLGCFSDYTMVPAAALRVVSGDIPLDHLTAMEPLGIAVRAVTEAGVAGAHVLILGCGPIGLFAIAAAKAYGASSITATDLS